MATQQSGGGTNIGVSTGYAPMGGAQVGGVDQGGMTSRTGQGDWSQFFGPSKGPIETAPYGSYRRENFALPDAYRGSNVYMTNVIITLVTEQASSKTRIPRTRARSHSTTLFSASPFPDHSASIQNLPLCAFPRCVIQLPNSSARDGESSTYRNCGRSRSRSRGA